MAVTETPACIGLKRHGEPLEIAGEPLESAGEPLSRSHNGIMGIPVGIFIYNI